MPLIYSLISRGSDVLVEYTSPGHGGNFASISRLLFKRLDFQNDSKRSLLYDQYVFHYSVQDGVTYLTMADKDFLRNHAYAYLQEASEQFLRTYGDRWKTAIAFSFQADFQRTLQVLMEKYNEMKDEKISRIQDNINAVKDVMVLNIEKVLERGERIELLVEKTEILDQHAFKFKRGATKLKRTMWWRNIKWTIIAVIVLALIIYIILAIACGPKVDHC